MNKFDAERKHSIEDVYDLLIKTEKGIREFKATAIDLEMRMDNVEKDILYLKMDALPNFINRIIVNIDEIKDRIDTDFSDVVKEDKINFENLSKKNQEQFDTFSTNLDGKVVAPITSFEIYFGDITDLLNEILEILKKE